MLQHESDHMDNLSGQRDEHAPQQPELLPEAALETLRLKRIDPAREILFPDGPQKKSISGYSVLFRP